MTQNKEECLYLEKCQEIVKRNVEKIDRTNVGTFSMFGCQLRYSLKDDTLPLLTTKKMNFAAIAKELLWFISGSTDSKKLSEMGVHIWDANGSLEFLRSNGFTDRDEGDLGPVYGFQWRHFGAKYIDSKTDYTGQGVDQLKDLIEKIKKNPNDRRLLLCAWNVSDIPLMALPPCHCLAQFYVENGELSCQLYQRSGDMLLGVPFNIASYSLLTHMICHLTGLKPGEFVHTIGDAHVYKNHIDGLNKQIEREPMEFPKIKINRKIESIDDFKFEDFDLIGYNPLPGIRLQMAL